MPSSPSSLLKLELQNPGENNNTWGTINNTQLELLEQALAKLTSVTIGAIDVTLTDSQYVANQARAMGLKLTGTLSADVNVVVPSRAKSYLIWNATSGAYNATVKTAAGLGVIIPQGYVQWVLCDGTDVMFASPAIAPVSGNLSLAGTLAVAGAVALGAALNTVQGADIASAGTIDLDAATGNLPTITGTTGVTAVTLAQGRTRLCRAADAFQLTHSSSLVLPGAANYTTVAGDYLMFIGRAAGVVQVLIFKGDGTSVIRSSLPIVNDFRMTLTSGTPVTIADVTAAGTLYLTPVVGNRLSLLYGGSWVMLTSAEVSLALTLTADKPYDIFAETSDGLAVTLSATVWTDNDTRATALTTVNGVLCKSGDTAKRYIGTIYSSGSNTTEDSEAKRYVWNYYHRRARIQRVLETADSWTYAVDAWRAMNNNSSNELRFVIGVREDPHECESFSSAQAASGVVQAQVGIATEANTTAIQTGTMIGLSAAIVSFLTPLLSSYKSIPKLGLCRRIAIEYTNGSVIFFGDNGNAGTAQSGIHGTVMA